MYVLQQHVQMKQIDIFAVILSENNNENKRIKIRKKQKTI